MVFVRDKHKPEGNLMSVAGEGMDYTEEAVAFRERGQLEGVRLVPLFREDGLFR